MIVARIRLNKLDAAAYATCFGALFRKMKELHPQCVVGETLVGILADWSDTQVKGLEDAIGQETVSKVMKGCQVGFNSNYGIEYKVHHIPKFCLRSIS